MVAKKKKAYRFSKLNNIVIAIVLITAVGSIGAFWLIDEYNKHLENIERLRKEYVSIRKLEVKSLINNIVESIKFQQNGLERELQETLADKTKTAWVIADSIYNKHRGILPEEEIKDLLISNLESLRFFNGRGYVWVHDTDYKLIAHPFRKDSIGKVDSATVDTRGHRIIEDFVNTALENPKGDFVRYYWNKPGVDEKHHVEKGQLKIAHLRMFEPFGWVIGVGEYIEELELTVQERMIRRIASVRHNNQKGYIFAHTRDGVCLTHIKKENIGENRWELLDASGMKVVQQLDWVGRQPGGGFLEYVGSINPDTGEPAKKISFVQSIDGWGWVLGSGVYLADIEERVHEYRQELKAVLFKKIITTLVFLFIVVLVGFVAGRVLFKGLLKELEFFAIEANDETGQIIDVNQFRIKELRMIAQRANKTILDKEKAQQELSRAKRLESIGVMAGGVAHDLNNILSGIVGYPDLILRKLPAGSELEKPVLAIKESGKRAATVVDDLLTIARGAASVKEHCELHSLIYDLVELPEIKKLYASCPEVSFKLNLGANHTTIYCSPVHIKKCLMNLLINGVESITGHGKMTLSTLNAGGDVSSQGTGKTDNSVIIQVSDSGVGISAADMEHVFDPFYTKKEMGRRSGTGLGLTVVWNTMVDHGGEVSVSSSSKGSTFTLIFPAIANGCDKKLVDDDIAARGRGEQVLVVDDEPHVAELTRGMLDELGYNSQIVFSGEEAVDYIRNETVDLIILDMLMAPGINGLETYRKISAIRPGQKAIITSGFSEGKDATEAIDLGVSDFIKKPFTLEKLAGVIQKSLYG